VVRNRQLHWAKGYGLANTNDSTIVYTGTLFQAGSISKPIAALAVLKLIQEGKVHPDTDVNNYLKNLKVKDNEYTAFEKVSLRRLLTHTAGMTVHGFPGYKQTDTFPSIDEVLKGEGNTPEIFVNIQPDSIWRYSGGGYTVMEKVVEDVTGLPFETYIKQTIFLPLDMQNSTYEQPLPESYFNKASAAYDSEGKIIEGLWHNYPEQAAAGLWTTPSDLAKYCIEVQEILAGKAESVLSKEIIEMMLTKHKNDWGLGPALAGEGDSLRFQHGGKNAGFTNNMIGFAYTGDAVIIMTNADKGGALIGEIQRSISNRYGWGIFEQRIVELADSKDYELEPLVGKYVYIEEVPGIGKYFVDLVKDGERLIVIDPNNGEKDTLRATDSNKFIDLEDGDEIEFTLKADSTSFIWNGQYTFLKITEK
jgi:CubicO group peptidase (beta-lactamase class C family)